MATVGMVSGYRKRNKDVKTMTDGTRLYYEEVIERTELARHADSKGRRHKLGLNEYTDAEIEKRHGLVRTYPMPQNAGCLCRA